MGSRRITHLDVLAYRSLMGVRLDPWELECIFALDDARFAEPEKPQPKPVARRPGDWA